MTYENVNKDYNRLTISKSIFDNDQTNVINATEMSNQIKIT